MTVVPIAKMMIGAGAAIIVVGLVLLLASRFGFGGLPGDIRFQSGRTSVFFPVATCLVLSLVLSIVMSLLARWRR